MNRKLSKQECRALDRAAEQLTVYQSWRYGTARPSCIAVRDKAGSRMRKLYAEAVSVTSDRVEHEWPDFAAMPLEQRQLARSLAVLMFKECYK